MKITSLVFKALIGTAIFSGFLTVSSELSRSQSEKPEIRPAWNPEKEILIATAVPVSGHSLQLEMPKFVAKGIKETRETQEVIKGEEKEKIEVPVSMVNEPVIDSIAKPVSVEKISTEVLTPQIPKVRTPAKAREEKAEVRTRKPVTTMTGQVTLPKLSPPALLTHRELQAMVNDLYYEILPGRGVRFQYSDLPDDHMGHMWFLKRPRDLRGKTVRIDYRGIVPDQMSFKIARSGTSAAVIQKIKLESSPYEPQSIFIDIPDKFPFKDVKYFEFWIDRESAGRSHGDFMIDKVVILEPTEKARMQAVPPEESRPERFPFDQPFMPTNLMRAEVRAS